MLSRLENILVKLDVSAKNHYKICCIKGKTYE